MGAEGKTLAEQVGECWADLISRHGLRVVPVDDRKVYVVVGPRVVISLSDHPSNPGLGSLWAVDGQSGWRFFNPYDAHWRHQLANRPPPFGEGLEAELRRMAWSLEGQDADLLDAAAPWTAAYEERFGVKPVITYPETRAELYACVRKPMQWV